MGVLAHKGLSKQPNSQLCVSMRVCVLIFIGRICALGAMYSLQCTECETKGVCVCAHIAIVSELSAVAGFFPPVRCFVGGVLAALSSNKEPPLPA